MRRAAAAGLAVLGAALLLWRLGEPALWQDEAETALRGLTVLESGLPKMSLGGRLVTAQPSLAAWEGTAGGVWTWNAWLPAYLAAASQAALGRTAAAARLPFALAAALTLWLFWGLFEAEEERLAGSGPGGRHAALTAMLLLCVSAPFILFGRQARYYALGALGTAVLLRSWRRLLAGERWGAEATALSLQLLLHSSFPAFAAGAAALAGDALLRGRGFLGRPGPRRAAALALAMAAPALAFYRPWHRPGSHAYASAEALEFLKTFLLWLARFALPAALAAAVSLARAARAERPAAALPAAAGAALLLGVCGEGAFSRACAAAAWAWLGLAAARSRVPEGELGLKRISLLLLAATLAWLSWGAAEPYGRYLAGVLPLCAWLAGGWIAELAGGSAPAAAALAAAAAWQGALHWLPLREAWKLAGPERPAESVSGMMRARLLRREEGSELRRLAAGLASGGGGYVEPIAEAMRRGGGETFFSDSDSLSFMLATGLRPVYPEELFVSEPDWLFPSPWLKLSPEEDARVRWLLASGRYTRVAVEGPRLLWQNNPDPLYRGAAPARGPLPLFRRVGAAPRGDGQSLGSPGRVSREAAQDAAPGQSKRTSRLGQASGGPEAAIR